MFPKKGKVFPAGNDGENGNENYASMIATALRSELGNTHQATKTVMRWTGANERTVKHWFAGHHGPGGDYLIVLMRESDAVLEAVLTAAGRRDAIIAARVLAAHHTMVEAMAMVEREGAGPVPAGFSGADHHGRPVPAGPDDRINDRISDRINDRINGRVASSPGQGLNPRQHWCLDALAVGMNVRAEDLQRRWGVSEKTARRDMAALQVRGMIEFVGSRKTGRYRLKR